MTEKKDKMINLKGANSTMKLGFLIYSVMVVAFITLDNACCICQSVRPCLAFFVYDIFMVSKQIEINPDLKVIDTDDTNCDNWRCRASARNIRISVCGKNKQGDVC